MSNTKMHEFQATTSRVKVKVDKKTRKRERIEEAVVYKFKGGFEQNEKGDFVMNLQYGYEWHYGNWCVEGFDSCLKGNRYRLVHQTEPREGDVITHISSGRQFTVGKDMEGFINHMFPLIENGVVKAYIKSEDYYKD